MKSTVAILLSSILWLTISSCDEDNMEVELQVPATYYFERNGQSTVSYTGQSDRINQLTQMKEVMSQADAGIKISTQVLLDMYANKDDNGAGNFDFTSTKQLKNKTFFNYQSYFENLMQEQANASIIGADGQTAANGNIGLLWRNNDINNSILVNEKGHELTQFIEKGLMAAVFYYQALSTYLSDERTGDDVENTELVEGKNYTSMEHYWDEAFGYMGLPIDFTSVWPEDRNNETLFWGKYIRGRDALLGSSSVLMNAFKKGRTAIVAKNYEIKNEQRSIIHNELERVAAATAIHYINIVLTTNDQGERMHALSEAYTFIWALNFGPHSNFTTSEINQLLKDISDDDFNFWNSTVSGLNKVKSTLSTTYALESVKDQL